MQFFILSFVTSCIVSAVLVRFADRHARVSADITTSGPQKFHPHPVPRIGGLGVFFGILASVVLAESLRFPESSTLGLLLVAALPTFLSGVAEDTASGIKPRVRLAFTAASAGVAIWLLDALIVRTHIPGVDQLIQWYPAAVALTVFTVTGVSNSVNIIDGFNGLASMCVLLMLAAVVYVAFQVGDIALATAALIVAGAAFGFFVCNYPTGRIFLGDGGAYLLGFMLAEMGILLIQRNTRVSPLFPLLLCAYPIFETIFTIYRRSLVQRVAAGAPDAIHLHTLIHRRLIRWAPPDMRESRQLKFRNSMTSPYLWLLCSMSVIPSVLWWQSTSILSWFLLLFVVSYVWIYSRIVRFKTPRWMVLRRNR